MIGLLNDRVIGLLNDCVIELLNGRVIGLLNDRMIGLLNDRVIGLLNDRTSVRVSLSLLKQNTPLSVTISAFSNYLLSYKFKTGSENVAINFPQFSQALFNHMVLYVLNRWSYGRRTGITGSIS
jgi:hypothetical protein